LFHLYLIAYGIFRFFHEFLRDTPLVVGPFSGYQFAALAVAALGFIGYLRRRKAPAADPPSIG
jgi:phosphatidylglycerol:prolipoprotein diacylglycerol transferase